MTPPRPDPDDHSPAWTAVLDQVSAAIFRSPDAPTMRAALIHVLTDAARTHGTQAAIGLAASTTAAIAEERLRLRDRERRRTATNPSSCPDDSDPSNCTWRT
jgi:hypothetical protein